MNVEPSYLSSGSCCRRDAFEIIGGEVGAERSISGCLKHFHGSTVCKGKFQAGNVPWRAICLNFLRGGDYV